MGDNDTTEQDTTGQDTTVARVEANGIEVNVATAGRGPAVLLLHGWPHTWRLWTQVIPALASNHRVIAPDLRGLGDSTRTTSGYDAGTLAADAAALLDALGESSAAVVAIDAGAPAAFLLALTQPERVQRLVLMEALLPIASDPAGVWPAGPPWWFGFHAVPDLAETVLVGHEGQYLDYFLTSGSLGRGIEPAVRDAFVAAYSGKEALRAGFEFYRAARDNAAQLSAAVTTPTTARLRMPTMAIGAHPVGAALHRQLEPISDDLTGHVLQDCGHVIPLDRPRPLLDLLEPFLAPSRRPSPGRAPDRHGRAGRLPSSSTGESS